MGWLARIQVGLTASATTRVATAFTATGIFTSGVSNRDGSKTISSERIKQKIKEVLSEEENKNLSDQQLTELLNKKGAKIARRTVAKYRAQLGLKNSYKR